MIHSVLERQIRKFLGNVDIATFPKPWSDFLQAISDTYLHYDDDRKLIERSLEISSKELTEGNQKLRSEIQNVKIKAEELNALNNLMVGREIKMIELKKEIELLKAKVGS